jgi:hypothetical protein
MLVWSVMSVVSKKQMILVEMFNDIVMTVLEHVEQDKEAV